MGELAAKSTRDAAAVKVLTIITLVYLPATVVSVCHALCSRSNISLTLSELFLHAVRKPKIEPGQHNHACDCWELVDLFGYICATDCSNTVCMVDLGSNASPRATASSVSTDDMVFIT